MTGSKFIGDRIKSLRKEKKLSQTELAKRINKSMRMLQKYENGETIPSDEVVSEIAAALEVDVSVLTTYYRSNYIHTLADAMAVIVELSETVGINLKIGITEHFMGKKWSCSLRFDCDDNEAIYNDEFCIFLEALAKRIEAVENYWYDRSKYEEWLSRTLADYESIKLEKRVYEKISPEERLERRRQLDKEADEKLASLTQQFFGRKED